MDTILLLAFLPQGASSFEGLTTDYGALYWGLMELGVQLAVANSALVPGVDEDVWTLWSLHCAA